jgi:DNA polymerase III delta prime subunit
MKKNDCLEAALEYLAKGFSIIPIKPREKIAAILWKEFQSRKATRKEIRSWFLGTDYNIGIVTGAISDIDVIDFDTPEAWDYGKKNFPPGPTVKTARGYQIYYKHRPGVGNFQKRPDLPGIDLRADGGYVIAPPSIHPSGAVYGWLGHGLDGKSLRDLPEEILKQPSFAPIKPIHEPVFEGSRHDQLVKVCGSLFRDKCTLRDVMEYAEYWNSKNSPPLPERELRQNVEDIYNRYWKGKDKENAPLDGQIKVVTLADVDPVAIDWIWNKWLAAGKVHIIAGPSGTGKTTIALALAATLSIPGRWPDGTLADGGEVLIWSGEDDPADTIRPRLTAMNADLSRIHMIDGVLDLEGKHRSFVPSTDMPMLEQIMDKKPIRLLIIDPIVSAVAGDSHKNADVRQSLQPLVDLGMKYRCAIFGITHFTKGTSGRDPLERVTGSLAFGALARLIFTSVKLPDEDGQMGARLFARAKSNIGPDGGGFKYYLTPVDLSVLGKVGTPSIIATRLEWGEEVLGEARELIGMAEANDDQRNAASDAVEWLRDFLSDGSKNAQKTQDAAKAAGISNWALNKAKQKLKITPKKAGFVSGWEWGLLDEDVDEDVYTK